MKLKIGCIYRIRGAGVMKLIDLHQPETGRTTCNFITAGAGLDVWISEEDVLGEADTEYLQLYIASSRRAGFHASADGVERWLLNPKGIGPGMIGNVVEMEDGCTPKKPRRQKGLADPRVGLLKRALYEANEWEEGTADVEFQGLAEITMREIRELGPKV